MSSSEPHPARVNRLAGSTSPYLLQHAHNPVDWYPWGDEALRRAVEEDRPIFLSIGYSACHWCHVMERESFENDDIAAFLNAHFVSIKVDREERPDLDEIYMSATQIYSRGSGGWPMSVFLTPDRRPFFAGTYFPPDSRYGRPGFKDLLAEIVRLWKDDRRRLLQGAEALTEAVRRVAAVEPGDRVLGPEVIERAAETYVRAFDREKGGMLSGATNKFPPSMTMQLMLRRYWRSVAAGRPQRELLERVERTLDQMARGGIYDQLGGGICRYSTDPDWLVPHFEKMLYDQALVGDVYLDAYVLTKRPLYAEIARGILDFVLSDLRSPEGGFYSALDADSEGQEGKYYVWTLDEIRRVLGEEDARLFVAHYDVTADGNWHEHHGHAPPGPKNILNVPRDIGDVARLCGVGEDEMRASLDRSRRRLLDVRRRRVPPALDDKVLTAWNGLMIATLARAFGILNEPRYRDAAVRAAEFVLGRLTRNGRLLRTYRDGRAHTGGYLDDYAFFIEGVLNLYEATGEVRWLDHAERLADETLEHFRDLDAGGFYFTADDAEPNIVRTRDAGDGAVPGGNSVQAMNLLRLAVLLGRSDLQTAAESVFRAAVGRIGRAPLGLDRLLAALDFCHGPVTEVVVVGPRHDPATAGLLAAAWGWYRPNRVIVWLDPSGSGAEGLTRRLPLLRDRAMVGGRPTAFVCEGSTCRQPVTTPEGLAGLLG